MTALTFADNILEQNGTGHYEIDGFPINWNADTHALIISSNCPVVLSEAYDYLRSASGDSLIACQSLYGRGGRHGLYFQFRRPIDAAVLDELKAAQANWHLLRPMSA